MESESTTPAPASNPAERFASGNRQAFDELYSLYAQSVLAFLMTRLRDITRAEDVLQEVWLKAWEKRQQFTGGSFRSWVFQIARTTSIDDIRQRQRRRETTEASGHHEPIADDESGTDDARKLQLQALNDCLEHVGGDFVEAVILTKIEGHTPAELASQKGVSRATIDTRVSRGKQLLDDCIRGRLQ